MLELVLIRGLPGSGKSTMAKAMQGFAHFEADQFFERDGVYTFDPAKLSEAHEWCLNSAIDSLQRGINCVVSNTFTRLWEMKPYSNAATRFKARLIIIEARGEWGSIHGTPESVITAMRKRWEPLNLNYFNT